MPKATLPNSQPYAVTHRPQRGLDELVGVLDTATSAVADDVAARQWPPGAEVAQRVRQLAVERLAEHRNNVVRIMGVLSTAPKPLLNDIRNLAGRSNALRARRDKSRLRLAEAKSHIARSGRPGHALRAEQIRHNNAAHERWLEAEASYNQFLAQHPLLGSVDTEAIVAASEPDQLRGVLVAGLLEVVGRMVSAAQHINSGRISVASLGPVVAEVREGWLADHPDDAEAFDQWRLNLGAREQTVEFMLAGASVAVSIAALLTSGGLLAPVLVGVGVTLGFAEYVRAFRQGLDHRALNEDPGFMPKLTDRDGDLEITLAVIGAASGVLAWARVGLGPMTRPPPTRPLKKAVIARPSPQPRPNSARTQLHPRRSHTLVSPSRSGSDVTDHLVDTKDILQSKPDGY